MRGQIAGLHNPHPMAVALPGIYQDDGLASRFVAALDDVLAPAVATLDNLDSYLDPALCPPDFLPWLAGWVGLDLDGNWSLDQQRRLVAMAVELARWHGTRRGIVELVCRYANVDPEAVEVEDTGRVTWSSTPGEVADGSADRPALTVRVTVADTSQVDADRLDRLVARAKPAHVAHTVVVTS